MRTMLEIIQDACRDVGQPRPSLVASSNDETPLRMLRLLNKAGRALTFDHAWNALTTVTVFTPTATQVQASHPPTDYHRMTPETEVWDITNKRPLVGPLTLRNWMRLVVDAQQSIDHYWTLIGEKFNILPVPAITDSFVYSYQSKNWVLADDDTPKGLFTADDDVPRIDDELLLLELVWRWKNSIGLDYAEDMSNAGRYKEMAIAADRGPPAIQTAHAFRNGPPDNFWPGTITP